MGTKPAAIKFHRHKVANKAVRSRLLHDEFPLPAQPFVREIHADARQIPLTDESVELVVTSPPYWRKRDYGFPDQIGQELTPQEYVHNLILSLREWRRILSRWGSIFLNIGDTYWNRSLAGIPGRVESAACDDGWILRNRIVWTKEGGMPEPARVSLTDMSTFFISRLVRTITTTWSATRSTTATEQIPETFGTYR
jgi:hypothetical protein